jgi:hypothetical protein
MSIRRTHQRQGKGRDHNCSESNHRLRFRFELRRLEESRPRRRQCGDQGGPSQGQASAATGTKAGAEPATGHRKPVRRPFLHGSAHGERDASRTLARLRREAKDRSRLWRPAPFGRGPPGVPELPPNNGVVVREPCAFRQNMEENLAVTYRKDAAECRIRARRAEFAEDREQWLALATQWEKLADDMEHVHAQLAADDERRDPRERRSA